jgi:hypothetical protein
VFIYFVITYINISFPCYELTPKRYGKRKRKKKKQKKKKQQQQKKKKKKNVAR